QSTRVCVACHATRLTGHPRDARAPDTDAIGSTTVSTRRRALGEVAKLEESMIRKTRILFASIVAMALGLLVVAQSTFAAETAARGVRNVVLVHGAWADGSSWSKVIPRLEKAGLNAVAVQNPLTSFDDDVAATKRAIAL